MHGYGFALLPVGAVLVLGMGYAALNNDITRPAEPTAIRAFDSSEIIASADAPESARNAAIAQWAAEHNLEFVPAAAAAPARPFTAEEPPKERIERTPDGGMTITADPEGGAPEVDSVPPAGRSQRDAVDSIEDLVRLNDEDELARIERGDVDVDLRGLRNDVNSGTARLGRQIRALNQGFEIPAVVGQTGAMTSGSRWSPKSRTERDIKAKELRREQRRRTVVLPER